MSNRNTNEVIKRQTTEFLQESRITRHKKEVSMEKMKILV